MLKVYNQTGIWDLLLSKKVIFVRNLTRQFTVLLNVWANPQ